MSAKQAINDKLQGSVATYFRCGGVVNNQIKKGLFLSESKKNKIGEYLAKLQAKTWFVLCTFSIFHTKCCCGAGRVRPTAIDRYLLPDGRSAANPPHAAAVD